MTHWWHVSKVNQFARHKINTSEQHIHDTSEVCAIQGRLFSGVLCASWDIQAKETIKHYKWHVISLCNHNNIGMCCDFDFLCKPWQLSYRQIWQRDKWESFLFFFFIRLVVLQEIACFLLMTGTSFLTLSTFRFFFWLFLQVLLVGQKLPTWHIAMTNKYRATTGFFWIFFAVIKATGDE